MADARTFSELGRALGSDWPDLQPHERFELARRLRQMDLLLGRISLWAERYPSSLGEEQDRLLEEAELDVECFYLMAFRARDLIRVVDSASFSASGVSRVRNQLLVHTEADVDRTRRSLWSFSFGEHGDARLHFGTVDATRPRFQDPGLKANVDEFRRELAALVDSG